MRLWVAGLIAGVWLGIPSHIPAAAAKASGPCFLGWDRFAGFRKEQLPNGLRYARKIHCPLAADELVLSWNVDLPRNGSLTVEASALYPGHQTRFYGLGQWSGQPIEGSRRSIPDQQDQDGEVQTDTLVLKQPCRQFELRITLLGPKARLKFLGCSLVSSSARQTVLESDRRAWGRTLPVPPLSQRDYPGGELKWCSPTSLAMVLAYWARRLHQPGWEQAVPTVAREVYDPVLGGTGNWPFNAAYAGSFPGLRAFITRLGDVAELEPWIARGMPVILSVSYDLLLGKAQPGKDDGHLVVCTGFTGSGDVVIHDPGTSLNKVAGIFPRSQVKAAWAVSRNTVYLIYPVSQKPPPGPFGHWPQP